MPQKAVSFRLGRAVLCLVLLTNLLCFAQAAPPNYEDISRTMVGDLMARHFDKVEPLFDENVARALPVEKLAKSLDSLLAQAGAFKSIEKTRSEEKQGYHIVYVTCSFERVEWDLIAVFDSHARIAQFTSAPTASLLPWNPPPYAHSEKFHERDVVVGSSPFQLPGTLTLPNGPGPFPAVVLVHGSGPNDRDETLGPTKMFKDLAWGLASKGIAVLRYDKRTRIYGAKLMAQPGNFTVNEETIDDARAAVAAAAAQPEIHAKHIFVAGHSLGGYVAPRIPPGDSSIAGLIVLAGNTRPMEDLLVEQFRYAASLSGKPTPEQEQAIVVAEKSAAQIRDPKLKPGENVYFVGSIIPASYFLDLRGYHPPEVAAQLSIPMLILQGERDYQVRMVDFDGWKKGLANKPNATFKSYPSLNHLFMPGAGPSSDAEYLKPNHVLQQVVDDIAAWIARQ